MENEILSKILGTQNASQACKAIFDVYARKKYCFVNFLYFANAMHYRIFESYSYNLYRKSLLYSDILLPDGIALQIFYRFFKKKWIKSLNGTDFIPYFLSYLGKDRIHLVLYGGTQSVIQKTADFYLQQGFNVSAFQNGFQEFNVKMLNYNSKKSIGVLLVARGTPLQEEWVYNNRLLFESKGYIVCTVGGLFDFLSGEEKRAPSWVVRIRIGETFWRIFTNPQKNLKKFLYMFEIFRWGCQKIVKSVLKKKNN